MRFLLFALILLSFFQLTAQFQDDFTDGDFSLNPTWVGDNAVFEVNAASQLHLISSGTDTSILVTTSSVVFNSEWSFYVKQSFNSSSNNHSRVYLVSDQSDIKGVLNGYFVQIGSTLDNVTLWRQDGNSLVQLIAGTIASTGNSVNELRIKVTCDPTGNWNLYTDDQAGFNYLLEGSVFDNTYSSSTYFGVFCNYTSSNSSKFYFDDFYVGSIQVDTIPPELLDVKVISSTQLRLFFNEIVDLNSSEYAPFYMVNQGIGNPISANRSSIDSSIVDLIFNSPFTYGLSYLIDVNGVIDRSGNAVNQNNFPWIWYNLAQGDIVINEIMADPSPTIGLPDAEYIELYNNSATKVDLSNWKIVIGSSEKIIPNGVVLPDSFVIIAHENNESQLSAFGSFIGLSSFSLTNSSATIVLKTDSNRLMHIVEYTDLWYQNTVKQEGGWSLEQIDPQNACAGKENWSASTAIAGGTPGKRNSIRASKPDIIPPVFDRVVVINSTNISVFWNETVDSSYSLNTSIYNISEGIGAPIQVTASYPKYNSYNLVLTIPIQPSIIYELTISAGIADCAGNITSEETKVQFGLPDLPDSNEIQINEILFNPKNTGVDFVEIYNPTDKIFDLKDLRLANWSVDNEEFINVKIITEDGFQLFPKQYYVLSISSETVQNQYFVDKPAHCIEMEALPTLNNTSGNLYLITKSLQMIDGMNYDESMHYALLNNPEGVSLERISGAASSFEASNWHSAAIPGRNATDFGGTPTYLNSQVSQGELSTSEWSVYPEIFSPDNDGFEDYLEIRYLLDQSGYTANVFIYNSKGLLIRRLSNNQLLETKGQIIWDGITDDQQKAPIGIYIVYVEMVHLNGDVQHYKLTSVLGGKF